MRSSRRRRSLALVVLLAAAIPLWLAIRFLAPRFARSVPPERIAPVPGANGPVYRATCAGPVPTALNAAFEHEVVELVNAERRAAGLPPLTLVEPLTNAARWFARDMAEKGYFSPDHDSYDNSQGRLVRVCDWSTRISAFYGGSKALAENIAVGAASPGEVVADWMRSPAHRATILGRGHSETGVGYWNGGPHTSYWVQDFGQRDDDARDR